MNPASKYKLLIWCVVLLVIANVAVLITIWILHHKEPKQIPTGTPADFLISELALDKRQQAQFYELKNEHQQQSFKIRGEIKDARDRFFKLLQQPNVNDSTKNAASAEVGRHLQQLEMITYEHFKKVRDICTPDQQKKFDEIIENVLRMMSAPPPNGAPPMNGRPPDDNMPPPPQDH